jgi:hypothetical protein
MVYAIQVCGQLARKIRMEHPDTDRKLVPLLCVQWKTTDDGQRNCPKYVVFHSKKKIEKLINLVGFIIGNRESIFDLASRVVSFQLLDKH